MSYKKVFWGVILILIGTLFILKNTGIIYFNWRMLFTLWPVLLILWGIAIIPIKSIYKLILSLAIVLLSILFINNSDYTPRKNYKFWKHSYNYSVNNDYDDTTIRSDNNDDDNTNNYNSDSKMTVFYEDAEFAHLDFNAGAGIFTIKETNTKNLAAFLKTGNVGKYYLKTHKNNNQQYIKFNLKDSHFDIDDIDDLKHHDFNNEVNVLLHPDPIWDFDFNIGAAEINFDLSKFKVKEIDIDAGASELNITLGDRYEKTIIDIDAGVSDIKIKIPKESGCIIHTETFLAGKNLRGFNKIKRGHYETDNLKTAKNIIEIDMQAAISSFQVLRY
ncbi:MAG: DUF5668 domain-containing protein [Bacteroidota bacterium]|nr:DUF5668 domain-containing protein [Bacteroidota bacterium]